MTTQEAKLILQAYRPGGEDAAEPFFAEALELAQTHDELKEWFDGQIFFDSTMGKALQSELPPAGLREAILTAKTISPRSKSPRSYNRLAWLCALAAAIVFWVGMNVFFDAGSHGYGHGITPMSVASFTQQVLDIKEQGKISLGKSGHDAEHLRPWLAQQGAPAEFVLPPGLHGMPTHGCQTYTVRGAKVTMICFAIENGEVAYLFIVDKSALKDAAPKSQADFHEVNGLAFASWTSGDKSYVLTGDLSMEALKKLI